MMMFADNIREPDVLDTFSMYAIWYGPDGADGDCATEVESIGGGYFTVTEYQDAHGYFDEIDDDYPIIATSITVTAGTLNEAFANGVNAISEHGGDDERMVEELPR